MQPWRPGASTWWSGCSRAGADVHQPDNHGVPPAEAAVKLNRSAILRRLIDRQGLPRRRDDNSVEAAPNLLKLALSANHRQAAKVLMDAGKMKLPREDAAWATSALAQKAGEGDVEYVKLLLQAGAPVSGRRTGGLQGGRRSVAATGRGT